MNLEPHHERMIVERTRLGDDLMKLFGFIDGNPKFTELSTDEQERMTRQMNAMAAYYDVLGERLEDGRGDGTGRAHEFDFTRGLDGNAGSAGHDVETEIEERNFQTVNRRTIDTTGPPLHPAGRWHRKQKAAPPRGNARQTA